MIESLVYFQAGYILGFICGILPSLLVLLFARKIAENVEQPPPDE